MLSRPLKPNEYDFNEALKNCTYIDQYRFHFRHEQWWRKETNEEKIQRFWFNQTYYIECLKMGIRYPAEIKTAREKEFHELRKLREIS